jgi:hypothetical protein
MSSIVPRLGNRYVRESARHSRNNGTSAGAVTLHHLRMSLLSTMLLGVIALIPTSRAVAMDVNTWKNCLINPAQPTQCTLDLGFYSFSAEIPVTRSGITISGPGGHNRPQITRGGFNVQYLLHVYPNVGNITIAGLVIDGGQTYIQSGQFNYHDLQIESNSTVTVTNVAFQNSAYDALWANTNSNTSVYGSSFQNSLDVALFSDGALNVYASHFTNNPGAAIFSRTGPAYVANNQFYKNQYNPPSGYGGQVFFTNGQSPMTVTMLNNYLDGQQGTGGTIINYGIELNCDPVAPINYSGQWNTMVNHTYSGYWIGKGLNNLTGMCNALLQNESISGNHGSGLTLYGIPIDGRTHISMRSVSSQNNPYDPNVPWTGYGVYFAQTNNDTTPICIDTASNMTTGNPLGAFNLPYTQRPSCPTQLP